MRNYMNRLFGNIYNYEKLKPDFDDSLFLAPGAILIGDVRIGKNVSIWYNCVVRGDVNFISIGDNTNVQDLSMLHVTNKKYPLNIGNNVTIGHSVKLHGCTIENNCLIGIGAVVLDGAIISKNSIVAAGSVVKPGFIVPSGYMVAGVPAKVVRQLNKKEIKELEDSAKRYVKYSLKTIKSLNK